MRNNNIYSRGFFFSLLIGRFSQNVREQRERVKISKRKKERPEAASCSERPAVQKAPEYVDPVLMIQQRKGVGVQTAPDRSLFI